MVLGTFTGHSSKPIRRVNMVSVPGNLIAVHTNDRVHVTTFVM